MDSTLILFCLLAYFLILFGISQFTSRNASNATYFTANRNSSWWLVAFGMIGASLSGVTFISVPGWVSDRQFSYMQMVLGYIPGYLLIAFVLMPLYYRLKLTTIYTYLGQRFGEVSYKTGSAFFLLSRLMGSALRMYLVANVLQEILFDDLGIPFPLTVGLSILLVWLYTFRAGIKTIVWTDTLQTAFMLLALIFTIVLIGKELNWGFWESLQQVKHSSYSQIFFFDDPGDARYFFKQFLSGALIALVMTGLDQDMMQKNLTCKNIGEAQKNMVSFSIVLIFANLLFLSLGALLYMYAGQKGIPLPEKADNLFGMIATDGGLGAVVGVFFVLGLVAAAYSSADSALTALTTSFCIDILGIERKELSEQESLRKKVHIGFSVLTVIIIIVSREFHDDSLFNTIFQVASYTYGPLLGLFAFGMLSKRAVQDSWTPFISVLAPLISFYIASHSEEWWDYKFGYEILLVNGLLTALGLWLSGLTLKGSKAEVRSEN
ncbi:MAG: sodium:solute symporter [Bacteroidota bacterium]|nr:sodium:solute symporter [Bacteroidota bacterium]MDX5429445.1 sodium:solute symporter [Bacteroidota bacterium]MDX5468237.1 sodium:solute symporter [Bacteroidota bacterium]